MKLVWISDNWIEILGAVAGIVYVFLEIRQNIWLWPVGVTTSAVYIWIFFTSKFYADMSLQVYYLIISCIGWYWWKKGARLETTGSRSPKKGNKKRKDEEIIKLKDSIITGSENDKEYGLKVSRLHFKTGMIISIVLVILYFILWYLLSRFTDSPVAEADSLISSLSIVATWMLARKIYEHWYFWIAVNSLSIILFITRGLYPTVFLYLVYLVMSFVGLKAWKKSFNTPA